MAFLHPKTKKRWLFWLSRLTMVFLVVPLVKLIAYFKIMHKQSRKLESREECVAEYLRLEYGEDAADPNSLKASDLA